MAAEPVSVRRNWRSGVLPLDDHAVDGGRQRRRVARAGLLRLGHASIVGVAGFGWTRRASCAAAARPRIAPWVTISQAAPDARVAAAAAHWGNRFTSNGTDYGDFTATLAQDHPLGRLVPRMGRHRQPLRAARRGGRGRRPAGDRGRRLAAGRPRLALGQVRLRRRPSAAARRPRAHRRLLPPGRRRADPARGAGAHPLRRPPSWPPTCAFPPPRPPAAPPVVIMVPGLDSTKEELQATAEYLLARGLATLAIDGPGQGEAEYELPIEPAYEKVATAAVDYLASRADVDGGRRRAVRREPRRLLRRPRRRPREAAARRSSPWPDRTASTWTGTSCPRRRGPPSGSAPAPPATTRRGRRRATLTLEEAAGRDHHPAAHPRRRPRPDRAPPTTRSGWPARSPRPSC